MLAESIGINHDRRDIPAKYDGIVFNCTTMRLKSGIYEFRNHKQYSLFPNNETQAQAWM